MIKLKHVPGCFLLAVMACGQRGNVAPDNTEAASDAATPVTIVSPTIAPLAEYIELNASSTFLKQAVVKASANGYIQAVSGEPGKQVVAGQELFTLRTKESQSIGNTINALDSTFKFSGLIHIRAATSGYIVEMNHQPGDYVQEGEQLAVINDRNSFVFVMSVPYELHSFVKGGKRIVLVLPDSTSINATVTSLTPVMDSAAQTQKVYLSINRNDLPVNLIARARIETGVKPSAVSLPKAAILSDETLTNFWVMKVADSATAIRVPVKTGLKENDRVEIVSPAFAASDRFVLSGNYGLPDTAKIIITKQE